MALELGTFKIPRYVRSQSQGEFLDLVKRIGEEEDINIKVRVMPPKRVISFFKGGTFDGYFPALDMLNPMEVHKSSVFYYKKDFLFSLKGKTIKSLKNKKLCLTEGYPYDPKLISRNDITFYYASSDESCLEMVIRSRVDGFVCEGLTGVAAINKLKLKNIQAHEKAISSMPVYFAFKKNEKGKQMAKKFTRIIERMRKNGDLSKLFEPAKNSVKYYLKSYDPTNN